MHHSANTFSNLDKYILQFGKIQCIAPAYLLPLAGGNIIICLQSQPTGTGPPCSQKDHFHQAYNACNDAYDAFHDDGDDDL